MPILYVIFISLFIFSAAYTFGKAVWECKNLKASFRTVIIIFYTILMNVLFFSNLLEMIK